MSYLCTVVFTSALVLSRISAVSAEPLRLEFGASISVRKQRDAMRKPERTLSPVRCTTPPEIDGAAEDPAWRRAAVISGLGSADDLKTTVHLLYDDKALYVLAVCDVQPGRMPVASVDRHDGRVWTDDCVQLRIQPSLPDGPQFTFSVNAAGVRFDAIDRIHQYNPTWTAATTRRGGRWILEAAIPAAALRLNGWHREIGFNVERNVLGAGQQSWNAEGRDTVSGRLLFEDAPRRAVYDTRAESPSVRQEGDGIAIRLERSYARPGERYVEAELTLMPHSALEETRLEVRLYALAGREPVADLAVTPKDRSARLLADLRSAGLEQGEVKIELFRGDHRLGAASLLVSAHGAPGLAAGTRIPVTLDVPDGNSANADWPITFGVPFAAGELWDAGRLRLVTADGREMPCQKEITGRWGPDGAIQWVRFDALVVPNQECFVEVSDDGARALPARALAVKKEDGAVRLDTGAAEYILGAGVSPIREIRMGGRTVAHAKGTRGLYVVDQNSRLASASAEGETVEVESSGPVAASVRFEGFYRTAEGEQLARHITRVEAFAGQPDVKVTHTLVLTNDTNEVWFREIGWELAVEPGASPTATFALSPRAHEETMSIPLNGGSAYMIQESHYHFAHGENRFRVALNGASTEVRREGEECGDWAALTGNVGGLQMACRDAARQHPKEFEVFPDRVVLKLFSDRAGEQLDFRPAALVHRWDLPTWLKHAGTGETRRPDYIERFLQYRSNAIGWAKTHQLLIQPVPETEPVSAAVRASGRLHEPVYAMATPSWIYRTRAMGPLYPRDPERFPRVEEAVDSAVRGWLERDAEWGENGFVDYFAGPRFSHRGKYPLARRYVYCQYTVRANLWRVFARSGNRALREFCEGYTRSYMDNIHMHWNTPPGSNLTRGLFRASAHFGVPVYWGEQRRYQIYSSSNLYDYIWMYQLTGYRRAREVVEQYAEGMKRVWTPQAARRDGRIIMMMRLLAQCFELTGDADLRDLARATTDLFEDPEGELGLTKDRPYRSSTYKMYVDVRALIDAWRIIGDPRYRRLAHNVAQWAWNGRELGGDSIGYNSGTALLANFLYEQTGNPVYAQSVATTLHYHFADYNPDNGGWPPRHVQMAPRPAFTFEIGYALDLLTRTGADKQPLTSWVSFDNAGSGKARVFMQKPDQAAVELYFRIPEAGEIGGTTQAHVVRAVKAEHAWGQDHNMVTQTGQGRHSGGRGKIRLPRDSWPLTYEIAFPGGSGSHHVYADRRVPLVLYAPDPWQPLPKGNPEHPPFPEGRVYMPIKYYFRVPGGIADAQIFFEGSGKLYSPDGAWGEDGRALTGWVDLPGDRPGLWAFEPTTHGKVHVRNIPPFFAAGDPESHFIPELE